MSGVELAIATEAGKALVSSLLSPKVYDFFSKWKLDTSLLYKFGIQLNSVEALQTDAQEKLIEENPYVEMWVKEARFAIYDSEDLLDRILADVPGSNKVRANIIDLVESSNSCMDKLKYKLKGIHPFKKTIEKVLIEIIERLQFIAAQKDVLGLKEKTGLISYRKGRLTNSLADETSNISGRSDDKKAIMHMLNSREGNYDDLRVISIVGMGGIGKTTLASLVFDEYKSLNRSSVMPSWLESSVQREDNNSNLLVFEVKGWASVSDNFDATRIIKSLLQSITGQESKVDNRLDLLQEELKKQLQSKRFLVVLDDVWSEDIQEWYVLRICFSVGAPGSRVIVTARSEIVARIVSSSLDFSHQLGQLSEDESWSLFEKIVFLDGNSNVNPILKDMGKEIVRRCKGLPLAIKMIGGLLLSKGNDESEWRNVMNYKFWESTKILPSLGLSYYDLPFGVQNCFAYCSIFPKDYEFSMEEVTMLWIGEGLIEKFWEGNRYEDVARAYFTHLRSKFFFQKSSSDGSKFVMHDLVHDLALHVSNGLCVDFQNMTARSRRLSYIQGKDEPLLNQISGRKLNHLRTFIPLRGDHVIRYLGGLYLNNIGDLLSNFKLLRVLSLENFSINTLPKSVGDMKLLRYLNLSWTAIDHLPDKICSLHNLQILLLSYCDKLKRLPAEICNLINLRSLIFEETKLKEMPDGIGRLTNIWTLSSFVVGTGKSNQLREFKEFLHLHGGVRISKLNNVDNPNDVVIAGFKNKEYIEKLVLDWEATGERGTELDEKVLDAIEVHKNLKSLTIEWYGGKKLSDWIVRVGPSFNLESLSITKCFNLEGLPSLGNLPCLKNLEMRGLDRIESIGEEFYGDSPTPFRALEKLDIDGMKVLKTWRFPEGDRLGFKKLSDLQIKGCPQLAKIPYWFPSLTQLDIVKCDNLVKLEMCEDKEGSSSRTTFGHSLLSICISSCPELEELPNSFANSEKFWITDCKKLVSVPRLQKVRELTWKDVGVSLPVKAALQDCGYEVIEELAINSTLSNLYSAEIHCFTSLKRLHLKLTIPVGPEDEAGEVMILPPNLSYLFFNGGDTTVDVNTRIFTELSNLNSLTTLHLNISSLESFPDVELPSTLKSLRVMFSFALKTIPDRFLSGCSQSLQELWIIKCRILESLPSTLSTLQSLQALYIIGCGSIPRLPTTTISGPDYLTNLSFLWINDCGALECLPDEFHKATTLHTLRIGKCPKLCIPKDYDLPTNLRDLLITDCGEMKSIVETALPKLTSLTTLELGGFPDISSLDRCLPESIQSLTIRKFPRLKSLSRVLPNLKNLIHLDVSDCPLVEPKSWSRLMKLKSMHACLKKSNYEALEHDGPPPVALQIPQH